MPTCVMRWWMAIKCGADLILTFNLDDFPEQVCRAMRQHRSSLKNPPKTVEEYLDTLEEQGLNKFSETVRHSAAEL